MRRTIATIGGLALAVCFAQFPEYAQQYEQRLGGAVDELRTITADFDAGAEQAGLTREQALARYESSPDAFLAGRGTSMQATFARYQRLTTALADLRDAGPIDRFRHLGDYLDTGVATRALEDFEPAVPVTTEGFAWGAAGFVLGYLVLSALIGIVTLPFRWRSGRAPRRLREI